MQRRPQDATGFSLKAEGWSLDDWPEAVRAVRFLREYYEAYRALRDGTTPAVSEGLSGTVC
jgi:hypothetical protein